MKLTQPTAYGLHQFTELWVHIVAAWSKVPRGICRMYLPSTCTLLYVAFHLVQTMKAPEVSQVVLAIAIFFSWVVFYFVKRDYGTAAAFHWLGFALLVIAIVMATRPSISIYSGFRKVGDLTGWKKAIVIVPIWVLACVLLTR